MNEYKIYNPDKITKSMINKLIDKGQRFDIIYGLEENDYDNPMEEMEVKVDNVKTIIGSIF